MTGQDAYGKTVASGAWATDGAGKGMHVVLDDSLVVQLNGISGAQTASNVQWAAVQLDFYVLGIDLAQLNLDSHRHFLVEQQWLIGLGVYGPDGKLGPVGLDVLSPSEQFAGAFQMVCI
jgi:hypothetical protein